MYSICKVVNTEAGTMVRTGPHPPRVIRRPAYPSNDPKCVEIVLLRDIGRGWHASWPRPKQVVYQGTRGP